MPPVAGADRRRQRVEQLKRSGTDPVDGNPEIMLAFWIHGIWQARFVSMPVFKSSPVNSGNGPPQRHCRLQSMGVC